MTNKEFITKYLGKSKGYPTDGYYKGQCLSIVKLYIKEVLGLSNPPPSGVGSAYGYWTNFPSPLDTVLKKIPNTSELIPKEGWIAVWGKWSNNPYGHISIVAKGSTNGTLKNYAQNWSSKIFQLESNRYTHILGFLAPIKEDSIIDDMTPEEKTMLAIISNNNLTEGDLRWVVDLKKNNTVEKLEKKIDTLEEKIKGLKTTISNQYKEMDEKDLEYGELEEAHRALIPKYQELQKERESCQTTEPTAIEMTAWQHIKYGFKLFFNIK